MIFSELYSAYYNAVASIIGKILEGEADEKELARCVSQYAFGESMLTILPSLKGEKWQLVHSDLTTPIEHKPTMPLTRIENQWLKAISLDPRIKLFGVDFGALDDVEPLFTVEDYYIYDKYADGDPFEDEGYIKRFRMILAAIRDRKPLHIEMINRKGQNVDMNIIPERLEYSEKDDKFRLITSGVRYGGTVNLGRLTSVRHYLGSKLSDAPLRPPVIKSLTLTVTDERNALERVMLHFAHFEKRAERIDDKHYRLTVNYDRDDETELVIRVLSFGPMVRVEAPEHFVNLIKERLIRQKNCNLT